MTRLRRLKTSFTAGEVSPRLLGRGDLAAFENGAARLRNVFIHPTGGVTRRAGTRYVAPVAGAGRLVPFEFNTAQTYLLVFSDSLVEVLEDDAKTASFAVPWTAAQLPQIAWTQSADTLLVCHPDVPPQKITRTAGGWTVGPWIFLDEESRDGGGTVIGHAIRQPYHKFADDGVTLTPSGTALDSSIAVTASADAFDAAHVGQRLRIGGRQIEVTAVASPTAATATVKEKLVSTEATRDWEEPAFSALRGWPVSVVFHQDRLVVGGSRDLPNRLWLSKSSDLFNFDLGEGLDDEAIEFAILSDQVNAIRNVFSGRHLQVFTSGAEWFVAGDPLTPETVQLRRQTRVGSPTGRNIPPRDVDGATLFVGRNGRTLREFLFSDVEQAYQANDLALLARHLTEPGAIDQDYDAARRLLHVLLADGGLATMTVYRAERVTAWSRQEINGSVRAVAAVGDDVYLLADRAGGHHILRLDDALALDWAVSGASDPPTAVWPGLDHLEGESAQVIADGAVQPDATVAGGAVTLATPASEAQIGLSFAHEIEPVPVTAGSARGPGQGTPVRLVRATFRLLETRALRVDCGAGFRELPFKRLGPAGVLDAGPASFTGDRTVRGAGWVRDGVAPLWRVVQDAPLPCTVLSVNAEIAIND